MVTRYRKTREFTSVATIFCSKSDHILGPMCLPHEWYIDVACASPFHRGANNRIMRALTKLALHNCVQALRLHATPQALKYWMTRGFRQAETIRDAWGRCLYSIENVDMSKTGLTRLVNVLSESPLPIPPSTHTSLGFLLAVI